MIDEFLPARKMYEAEQKILREQGMTVSDCTPFDKLPQIDKDRYVVMARAAADNSPAPLFLEVGLSFTRQRTHPIQRHLYLDETVESIDAGLKELRDWILMTTGITKRTPPIGCE